MDALNCNACGKHFSTKYNLRKHVEALHLKLKPFACPLCAKRFAYQHSHFQHMQGHSRGEAVATAALTQTKAVKVLGDLLTLASYGNAPYQPQDGSALSSAHTPSKV